MIRTGAVILLVCLTALPALSQMGMRMLVPPRIYAAPGVEMSLYFDNVVLHPNADSLLFDVNCSLGRHQQERWVGAPTAEQVGEYPLTLRIVSPQMEVIDEATTTVEVVDPAAGAGRNVSVLCVGDSLTNASQITARLLDLFAADEAADVTLIGESGPGGDTGNRHEGYGGWRCETFATTWDTEDWREVDGRRRRTRSPFLFMPEGAEQPVLDFQRYLDANNAGQPPDFITILLGCNDNFGADETSIEASIDTMFLYLDQMLAAFRAAAPDTPIAILTLAPPAASQDAFAASYACGQTRWQYRRNQHRVIEREYATYGNREAEGIFVVPVHHNLDTVRGFGSGEVPANAHATETIARMNNGVHPSTPGYWQIGDSIYCWIKSRLGAN